MLIYGMRDDKNQRRILSALADRFPEYNFAVISHVIALDAEESLTEADFIRKRRIVEEVAMYCQGFEAGLIAALTEES